MTLASVLWILVLIAAFCLGLWWGLPGRYTQTAEDIEKIMAEGGRRRRPVKRVFTPLAWVRRRADPTASRERLRTRGSSRTFKVERPEDRRAERGAQAPGERGPPGPGGREPDGGERGPGRPSED